MPPDGIWRGGTLGGWDWAEAAVRRSVRGSLRRELAGVYVRGSWPAGGVLAPNHHSWWDGYLLRELAWQTGQPFTVMMTDEQLSRFPFLRRGGALGVRDLRGAVRRAAQGHWVVVFPEGEIRPAGPPAALHPGAAWLAQVAGVALYPVALRLALRGAERPEAFIRFGVAVPPASFPLALHRLVADLDADLFTSCPGTSPDGYLRVVAGRQSRHDTVGVPARMLTWLTGDS